MARSLRHKTNVQAPDSDYLYGRVKDNPGDNSGTPVNEALVGDSMQFFEKMMFDAGLAMNELPENAYTGFQYNQALATLIGPTRTKIVDIGSWDINGTSFVDVAHGLSDISKIRRVSVIIRNDAGSTYYDFIGYNANSNSMSAGIHLINSTVVELIRSNSSLFATDAAFDGTGFSRGTITIEYAI